MKRIRGIWLPDSDTHFEYHLMAGPMFEDAGTYQFKKIKAAMSSIQKYGEFNTAVDVGGHVGLWARVLGYYFKTVHVFEPIDDFLECLKKNVEACPNEVHIHPYAVSSQASGMLTMSKIMDNTGNTHVRATDKGGPVGADLNHPVVQTINLDSFDTLKVDFLKIDVEGYELEILKGASRILTQDRPIIVLEQKPNNAERYGKKQLEALNYLKRLGYEELWESAGDHCVRHRTKTENIHRV